MKTESPHSVSHAGRLALALATMLLMALAGPAKAQSDEVPDLMSYQGYLTDSNGDPLAANGPENFNVLFRIYASPTGGTSEWSEEQVVTVDRGYFSVVLGEGSAYQDHNHSLSEALSGSTAGERYLLTTVTINGSPTPLLPRIRLLPSAYSFMATRALNVEDGALSANVALRSGGNTFDGNQVFNDRVGIGASSSARLHVDGQIRSTGSAANLTIHNPANQSSSVSLGWLDSVPRIRISGTGDGTRNGLDIQGPGDVSLMRIFNDGSVMANAFVGDGSGLTGLPHPSALDAPDGNPTSALSVDNSGRVGIGTASPGGQLEIQVADNSNALLVRRNTGTLTHDLGVAGSGDGYLLVKNSSGQNRVHLTSTGASFFTGGFIGIGTANPGVSLDVRGQIQAAGGLGAGSGYTFNGSGDNDSGMFSDADGTLKFYTDNRESLRITPRGHVGINNVDPGDNWALRVNGDLFSTAYFVEFNGNLYRLGSNLSENDAIWIPISDARLKEEIRPITSALETVTKLRGVTWHWNEEGLEYLTKDVEQNYRSVSGRPEDDEEVWAQKRNEILARQTQVQYGFVAQEVEKVFPSWVTTGEDGIKKVHMERLGAFLVEAIKAQQQEIKERSATIRDLEARLAALETRDLEREARLATLERRLKAEPETAQRASFHVPATVTQR